MKKKKKEIQLVDGQGIAVKSSKLYRRACCDCNLVHDVVLVSRDKKAIGVAMRRNKEVTKVRRKGCK